MSITTRSRSIFWETVPKLRIHQAEEVSLSGISTHRQRTKSLAHELSCKKAKGDPSFSNANGLGSRNQKRQKEKDKASREGSANKRVQ
jgi:hypothetical protein